MSTVFGLGYYDEDYLVRSVREITDFLLTVNSALNFIVYCAFNTVFRNRFRALITAVCRRGRQGREEVPLRRRPSGGWPAAVEVAVPASRSASQDRCPRPVRCSVVVGTSGGSVVIICNNSADNVIELISVNHDSVELDHRTVTTSMKQAGSGTSHSQSCKDTDTEWSLTAQ